MMSSNSNNVMSQRVQCDGEQESQRDDHDYYRVASPQFEALDAHQNPGELPRKSQLLRNEFSSYEECPESNDKRVKQLEPIDQ